MKKKVLVAGATGYLGKYVVKELKKRHYWVRILIRKESQKKLFDGVGVDEFFVGQITQPQTIKGVADGIDWVFTSVGITRQKDGLTYLDVDYQGNMNLLAEAEQSTVTWFSYVSVLGAEKLPQLKIIQAKEKFVSALQHAKMPSGIIRPSGFFGDLVEVLDMAKSKKVYLFGSGEYKINPISGHDLAIVCVDSMEQKRAEINVGGPKVYSYNEIGQMAFDALGVTGKIIHLPIWLKNMSVSLLRTFTSSKFYGPYEFFLNAMLLDGVTDKYGTELLEDFYRKEAKG